MCCIKYNCLTPQATPVQNSNIFNKSARLGTNKSRLGYKEEQRRPLQTYGLEGSNLKAPIYIYIYIYNKTLT